MTETTLLDTLFPTPSNEYRTGVFTPLQPLSSTEDTAHHASICAAGCSGVCSG